jgi:hypothetical protein
MCHNMLMTTPHAKPSATLDYTVNQGPETFHYTAWSSHTSHRLHGTVGTRKHGNSHLNFTFSMTTSQDRRIFCNLAAILDFLEIKPEGSVSQNISVSQMNQYDMAFHCANFGTCITKCSSV